MFTFQTTTTKRRRHDDSDSDDGGYEQHQMKRSRPWFGTLVHDGQPQRPASPTISLRLSPPPMRHLSDLEVMTPAQSDHSESPEPQCDQQAAMPCSELEDHDMEMDEDEDVTSQPPGSPSMNNFMRPAMLNASLFGSDTVVSNGRMPTPIHPTFMRSGMNGLASVGSSTAGGINIINMGLTSSMPPPSSRKNKQEMDLDRSRRMPSPISEDEDIPDTPTMLTQSQLARLSFSQANPGPDLMETETDPATLALPPTPRGRKRSGAFTGMGRFSMGYRDDCEKCRQKVPGHFSHFLT